MLDKLY